MVHAAGGTMVSLQPCHLGDPSECAKLVDLAVSEFGRIDVLYNLAARSHLHWFEPAAGSRRHRSGFWAPYRFGPPDAGGHNDRGGRRRTWNPACRRIAGSSRMASRSLSLAASLRYCQSTKSGCSLP